MELVRAVLLTTNFDIIVMSERNGAINAIAEKFKDSSLHVMKNKEVKVTDMMVWMSLITYGSGDAMGASTKLFTVEGKLR